jgi:hypothetical protein
MNGIDYNSKKSDIKGRFDKSCACVEAIDRIASKTFLRLSYEYNICMIRREEVPSIVVACLKSIIGTISTDRSNNDMAIYINLFDLITFGLVELNFDDTEKSTNILPDFRIGRKGCELCGMDYDKYMKHQQPLDRFSSRVINIDSIDCDDNIWNDIAYKMSVACSGCINLTIDDPRLLTIILEIFLEEMFYDLRDNKKKNYSYKLFDILYFNYKEEDDMFGTDVMPEYKLMVKNDTRLESYIEESIEGHLKEEETKYKSLKYN